MSNQCEHGALARQCLICELEQALAESRAECERLTDLCVEQKLKIDKMNVQKGGYIERKNEAEADRDALKAENERLREMRRDPATGVWMVKESQLLNERERSEGLEYDLRAVLSRAEAAEAEAARLRDKIPHVGKRIAMERALDRVVELEAVIEGVREAAELPTTEPGKVVNRTALKAESWGRIYTTIRPPKGEDDE